MKPLPVLVLAGPTASGKTDVLEALYAAGGSAECSAEIVSADSMQVYRGMDIGTAKPSAALRARLPHHLIDIRDPDEQFSAGDFARLAAAACRSIASRGKLPVVSGGTGFYLAGLLCALPEAPPADPVIRQTLRAELAAKGAQTLYAELAACDSVSAARIHINDTYRLLRALEVFRLSGRPLSAYRSGREQSASGEFRFTVIGLERARAELHARVEARAKAMWKAGLPDEVRTLAAKGHTPRESALRAIGYREFFEPADPADPAPPGSEPTWRLKRDFSNVLELITRNSRRYLRRQLTYFKTLPGLRWLPPEKAIEALRPPSALAEEQEVRNQESDSQ